VKFLKYALAAAGALVFVAAALVAYVALTFDVRDYEPRIIALVKEKTGRTLTIRGETKLSFWPDLGVTLGPVSLSERDSDALFAEVENARLVAKLKPLLDRQLVADELHLEGASLRITRYRDGHLNIDDLLGGEGGTLDFDIARARVLRSRVVYEDLASGQRHEISGLDLTTGRLANGVTTPITLAFSAGDTAKAYAVTSSVQGRLTFDLKQRLYTFDNAALHIEGRVPGAADLTASIDVGTFSISNEAVGADKVSVDARAAAWHARVKAPSVGWREGAISAADAALDFDLARDGRTFSVTTTGALTAAVAARTVDIRNVRAKLVATGAGLPKRGIEAALTGSGNIDAHAQQAQASFAGTVLDSRVKAKLDVAYAAPRYTFALDVDAIDLDRLGVATSGDKRGAAFDVASLSDLRAAGTVRIGILKTSGVVAKNVQIAMQP
jgi:AsmA protein